MTDLWAVVPAAGAGRRMAAAVPKQYLDVAGAPLLEHTLQALLACERLRGLALVLDAGDTQAERLGCLADARILRAAGGAERADSVLSGLRALTPLAADSDWVLVHDAARPCLPLDALNGLVDEVLLAGVGALLAQRCTDTIKQVDTEGNVQSTLDRGMLWRAQTPQMFRLGELRSALESALAAGASVTDEASAMEHSGYPVKIVEGPPCNIKVTVPEDMATVAQYLAEKKPGAAS